VDKVDSSERNSKPGTFLFYGAILVLTIFLCLSLLSLVSNSATFFGDEIRTFEQIAQVSMPFLFILFFSITLLLPLALVFKTKFEKMEIIKQKSDYWPNSRIVLILSIILVVILMGERYLRYALPTGGDTPLYIISLNDISNKGVTLNWLNRMTSNRIFVLLFSPLLGLNLSSETIIKMVPSILGIFYALAAYRFLKDANVKIGALSSLAAVLSSNILTLSSQLYANFFAIGLMMVFYTYYLKSIEIDSNRNLVLASICQFFLLQIYPPAWIFSTGVVFVFLVISLAITNDKKHIFKTTMKIYIPSILVIIVGPFLLRQIWDYDLWANYYLFESGLRISLNNAGSLIPAILQGAQRAGGYDFQSFLMENSIVLFFAIIGSLILVLRRNDLFVKGNVRNFIVAWVFVPSLLLPLFPTGRYRVTLYYPIPILVAIAIFFVITKFSHLSNGPMIRTIKTKFRFNFSTGKVKVLIPLFLISLILLNFSFIRLRESPLIYARASAYTDDLYWIRENYDPKTTIICIGEYIYKPPIIYDSDVGWVQAITQAYIYVGKLFELLSGRIPTVTDPWVNIPPLLNHNGLNQFNILVFSRQGFPVFYSPDIVEKQVLKKVHEDVFQVKQMTQKEINSWINAWYLYNETGDIPADLPNISLYDNSFKNGWKASPQDINFTISEYYTNVTINSATPGWKSFYINNGTSSFLPVSGSSVIVKINYPSLSNEMGFHLSLYSGSENAATIYFPSSGSNGWQTYSMQFNSTLINLIEIDAYMPKADMYFEYSVSYVALLE